MVKMADLFKSWLYPQTLPDKTAWCREDSEDYEEPEEPDFVDFLVRLSPFTTEPPLKCNSDGWFPIGIHPRKPEICPVGIKFHRVT
jgi:hypothetical protein